MSSRTYVKLEANNLVKTLKDGKDLVWMEDANAWNTIRNLNGYIKDDDAVMMYTDIIDDDHIEISCKFGVDDNFVTGLFRKYKFKKLVAEIDDSEIYIDAYPVSQGDDDPVLKEYEEDMKNVIMKYKITYEY